MPAGRLMLATGLLLGLAVGIGPLSAQEGGLYKAPQHGFTFRPPKGWKEIPVPPPSSYRDDSGEKKEVQEDFEMVTNFQGTAHGGREPGVQVFRVNGAKTVDEALKKFKKELSYSQYRKIAEEKDVTVNKVPAKRILVTTGDHGWTHNELLIAAYDRAYRIDFFHDSAKSETHNQKKFLDATFNSFAILEKLEEGRKLPSGWSSITTAHYDIQHNAMRPESAQELAAHLEKILAYYQKLFPCDAAMERFTVKFFKNEDEFSTYAASNGVGGAAAYFSPSQNELVAYDSGAKKMNFGIIYHEGNHQYMHYYMGEADREIPTWLSEGLAEYFYAAGFKNPDNIQLGAKLLERLPTIKQAVQDGNFVPLKKIILEYTQRDYYSKAELCYAQGWSIVHFTYQTKDPAFKGLTERYIKALKELKDKKKADAEVFGKVDWEAFEKAWSKFIHDM